MIFRFGVGATYWIDLENPSVDEVREITREFAVSGRLIEEMLSPSPLPLALYEESTALLVTHFPSAEILDGRASLQEIDFVVGPHFVLTVRYEVIPAIHELRKFLESGALLGKHSAIEADTILELLFNRLFGAIRIEVAQAGKRLEKIEREMVAGSERKTVLAISLISRELLHLEASLAAGENTLTLFLDELTRVGVFGATFATRAKRILSQRVQTVHGIATLREIATELRETNMSLLTASQNGIMKTLTVISFIILPLGLIANVFTMNVADVPFRTTPHGFLIVVGIMLCVSTLVAIFVNRKRWL